MRLLYVYRVHVERGEQSHQTPVKKEEEVTTTTTNTQHKPNPYGERKTRTLLQPQQTTLAVLLLASGFPLNMMQQQNPDTNPDDASTSIQGSTSQTLFASHYLSYTVSEDGFSFLFVCIKRMDRGVFTE